MIRTITLHGRLASLYDGAITIEADSVAEALRALSQYPELHAGGPHSVQLEGISSDIALYSLSDEISEIHIHPVEGGAGGKYSQILIGVLLVTVAILNPAIGAGIFGSSIAPQVFLMGAGLVLGGILQLLIPTPDSNSDTDKSRYLGSSVDSVTLGTRIAYVYGTRKISGQYLSFDVDAVEIAPEQGSSSGSNDQNYFEHDVTSLSKPRAPVTPVYAGSAPALGVQPISSWGG
jgi:predicted phage tail protein